MLKYNIFSKRNNMKDEKIFVYDSIPQPLRVQIIHIWKDSIGQGREHDPWDYKAHESSREIWEHIHNKLCREYGVFSLSNREDYTFFGKCVEFILNEQEIEKVIDIIEISFSLIDTLVREYPTRFTTIQKPDDAIEEVNHRFQEHGIGYQFIKGQIVRVDSDYIYSEAVEPAINNLFANGFEGASEEFMKAHEHYRKGNDKEAVTEALKAYESVMKTICIKLNWQLPSKQTAAPLINLLFEKELISTSLQTQLTSLKTTLEGLATIRNKNSAHGQGEKTVKVPRYIVAYALHLCATNIIFLIEAYKDSK